MKGFITDIFFDLDHTLWDFERNSKLTFKKIFEDHGIGVDIDVFLEVYIPLNMAYWKLYREARITKEKLKYIRLRESFERVDYRVDDAVIHALSADYVKHLPYNNHLFDNTTYILDYLKKKYKLHIITNGFEEIQRKKLVNAKIEGYFTHVINSEMAGVKKPDPKIFEFALRLANVSPKKSVMIGDSLEADILGARKVGMQAIHFNINNEAVVNGVPVVRNLMDLRRIL